MTVRIDNPFREHFVAEGTHALPTGTAPGHAYDVHFQPTRDIENERATWEQKGYERVGWCEFADKGARMGISHLAREQAAAVGASVVLFQSTPAKVRSIRKGPDGRIDMSLVHADPPASLSPRGTYVVHAVFLAGAVSSHGA